MEVFCLASSFNLSYVRKKKKKKKKEGSITENIKFKNNNLLPPSKLELFEASFPNYVEY